jgi:pre-mRNA-splicing factor CWC22
MRSAYKEFLSGLFASDGEEEEQVREPQPEVEEAAASIQENVEKNEALQIKRRVYLTIVSNVTSNATAHVLLKMADELGEKYEGIIIGMCVDYAGMEKTYSRDHGVLVELLCRAQSRFTEIVEGSFVKNYADCFKYTVHRITNLASLYAYLLSRGVVGWHVMCILRLTEIDTTSAQRVFIRILMEELAHNLSFDGIVKKFAEPEVAEQLSDLFPTDSLENAEFAAAFFNEIQLGFLCDLGLNGEIRRMAARELAKKEEELELIRKLQDKRGQPRHRRHHRSRHYSESASDSD